MTKEEAIKIIESNCSCSDSKLREACAMFIPELRESEDERIRKWLIKYFNKADFNGMLEYVNGIKAEDILAWLEKQKYDRMKPVYDARESFESALEKAWNDYHNGYENVDKLEDDYVECAHAKGFREGYLFGIEKQKENSDTRTADDLQLLGFIYDLLASLDWRENYAMSKEECLRRLSDYRPQKPAEWSEEDEEALKRAIDCVRTWEIDYCDGDNEISERLKSLTERFNLQVKNEWSEEDKKYLNRVINSWFCDFGEDSDTEKWLKSLPERFNLEPKQEWSDEDSSKIGTLSSIIFDYAFYKDALDENNDLTGEYAELDNWLGYLPERFNLPPKQEWSEEDEENISKLHRLLVICQGEKKFIPTSEYEKLDSWLKSLRSQSHWKPSDEQMKWLKNAIEIVPMTRRQHISVESLYNNLKKL